MAGTRPGTETDATSPVEPVSLQREARLSIEPHPRLHPVPPIAAGSAELRETLREAPSNEEPLDGQEGAAEEQTTGDAGLDVFAHARPSDFGSLLADLSRDEENPRLRVHDRTHLEISVDYDLLPGEAKQSFMWEAYFFVPESLRLDSRTYGKQDVYEDLQSYVRFAVPEVRYDSLSDEPLARIERALAVGTTDEIIHEMRLFVCQVRAAGVLCRREVLNGLDRGTPSSRSRAIQAAGEMVEATKLLVTRARAVFATAEGRPEPIATAVAWIEEDLSRLLETMLGDLAMGLRRGDAPEATVAAVEAIAVDEARYRDRTGLGGVGRMGMSRRELEALEFRRHVLKRFTSSVLWLKPEVRPASEWVLHLLYAVAASVAMGFATMAALWNGADMTGNYGRWVLVAIVAYAAKDRIKAFLQTLFANVVSRHFPDRSWRVMGPDRRVELGTMEEQAGFLSFGELPEDVLDVRRSTRRHDLEERARPETVLFHRKEVELQRERIAKCDERFDALTEILRLDLRRWLAHTDDPKREFVFADPKLGVVGSAVAPRVYNLGVVYRLRRLTGAKERGKQGWHRARVVVTRKGIRRIDPVQ
jgi:hypothetical protein